MKKILTLLMAMTIALFGAFSLNSVANVNAAAEADNRPVLKVGMECAYQPYNWTQYDDSNGAVEIYGKKGDYANGYDVMIAKKIAEELDMKLEIHAYPWDNLIPAVQSGALDLIVAGMSPTDERKNEIDFTSPYFTSNLVVVVRKDGAYANATSIADLAGAKIVAQLETYHDKVIDQIPNVKHLTAMTDFPAMIIALNAKTIDGYVAEKPGATADCNANSDFKFIDLVNNENGFTVEDLSNVTLAIGVKKGNELLAQVNAVIESMTTEEQEALMLEAIEIAPKMEDDEGNLTWLFIALGVVAVVAIGAAVYFFVKKKKN